MAKYANREADLLQIQAFWIRETRCTVYQRTTWLLAKSKRVTVAQIGLKQKMNQMVTSPTLHQAIIYNIVFHF